MKLKYKYHTFHVHWEKRAYKRIYVKRGDVVEALLKVENESTTVLVKITKGLNSLYDIGELDPLSDSVRDLTDYSLLFLSTKLE